MEQLAVRRVGTGAHLVGFSYGGVGAVIAALQAPEKVRSLTVIEAPLREIGSGSSPSRRQPGPTSSTSRTATSTG